MLRTTTSNLLRRGRAKSLAFGAYTKSDVESLKNVSDLHVGRLKEYIPDNIEIDGRINVNYRVVLLECQIQVAGIQDLFGKKGLFEHSGSFGFIRGRILGYFTVLIESFLHIFRKIHAKPPERHGQN